MKNSFILTVIISVIACIASFTSCNEGVSFSETEDVDSCHNSEIIIENVSLTGCFNCDDSEKDDALLVSTRGTDSRCCRTLKHIRTSGAAFSRICFVTTGAVVKKSIPYYSRCFVRNNVVRDYISFRNLRI